MRVAVLYWPISGVGGISTFMKHLEAVAVDRGDTFHVLCSPNQKGKDVGLLPTAEDVAGGASKITIHGYAPHHMNNYEESAEFISKNYDVVLTAHLCPRPNKAYGEEPIFMNLLESLKKKNVRMIGFVHDGYWDTYKEFGEQTIALMEKTIIAQTTYAAPILANGASYPLELGYLAVHPRILLENEDKNIHHDPNEVVWLPQWKRIKGVHLFWDGLKKHDHHSLKIKLYGCGIEYYNACLEDDWKRVIGQDHFRPDCSGTGNVEYFGTQPYPEVSKALQRATYSVDFQGHSAKYKAAYENGSYNFTHIESLFWGCIPVVCENFKKTKIPSELYIPVRNPIEWIASINDHKILRSSVYNTKLARDFVLENHSASKFYDRIFSDDCEMVQAEPQESLTSFFA